MQPLIIIIEGIARGKNSTMKVVSSDTIKIQTIELEDHKAVIDILKANKAEFHTYQPRQQTAYRVVIRNLHYSTDQDKFIDEIETHSHSVRNLWNIKHKVTKPPLSLFFLDL